MVIFHEEMTPEEEAIANHFEQGLTDEELTRAEKKFGPAASELLPTYLNKLLQERAMQDGVSELDIVRKAVEQYLIPA